MKKIVIGIIISVAAAGAAIASIVAVKSHKTRNDWGWN